MTAVQESGDSQIINAFKQYAVELTAKHDKHERIVKISRDITIESKKLIFAIHALPTNPDDVALEKIRNRFSIMVNTHFQKIALELENDDPYLFHRAYTYGVQEYVEALTYFHYVTENRLLSWESIVEGCKFTIPKDDEDSTGNKTVQLELPLSDYILGIQDMTGEAMRLCIYSLGKGIFDAAKESCNFVKFIYAGLLLLQLNHKEYSKKMEVAEQSLKKMEFGCYLAYLRQIELQNSAVDNVS